MSDTRPSIDQVRMLAFQERGDERGRLVIAEGGQDIPFEIKRVFYIYDSVPDVVRGRHANRISEFVLINMAGSSRVRVTDGARERDYVLDRPHTGIYIPRMIWKEMYAFSEHAVLLVLSSEHYDAAEYLRDYDEYLEEVKRYGEAVDHHPGLL